MRLLEDFLEACDPSLDEACEEALHEDISARPNSDKIREWLNEGILDNATLVDMLLVGLPDNAFSDLVIEIGMQLDEE